MDTSSSKFQLIHELVSREDNVLTITELCSIARVSGSGYYNRVNSKDKRDEQERKDRHDFELILEAFSHRGYDKGVRGIHMRLLHMDPPILMNVKKISRLMHKYNLICPIRQANPYRRMAAALKTNNVADNLVNREFEEHGPRSILLTDITYIPYNGTFAYLSTIIDAFTKQVLSYAISDNLKLDFVLLTVEQLIRNHRISLDEETIIHSDRGVHYTSYKFIEIVKDSNLRQSMPRRANCRDNAPQESFFGHMKDEIDGKRLKRRCLVETALNRYN